MNDLNELFDRLLLEVNYKDYYILALTHPSYNSEVNSKHKDYETLEYVGDSVIGLVAATLIFNNHPEMNQGNMSKLRSHLVCSKSLAGYAKSIDLQNYIRVGHSISQEQLFNSDKILEDVFEAFIGAIYLDLGFKRAFAIVESFLLDDVKKTGLDEITDAKTRLQEEIQCEFRESVQYIIVNEEGPAHDRTFEAHVLFNGIVLGKGVGKSKKQAEEAAAKDALSKRSI